MGGHAHPLGKARPPDGATVTWGGEGEREGFKLFAIEVAWNNKYTHSPLNVAHHILGIWKKALCLGSPSPHPQQQSAFMTLWGKARGL